jgi:hypothetical protein
VDGHETIGVIARQAANHGVHDREHRAVHADAQRERHRCRECEPAVFPQQPSGKSKVLPDVARPSRSASIPAHFLHLIETTEFQTRSTPRVTFCQARRDVIRRQAFDMVT